MAHPTWSLKEVVHLLKDGQGSKSLTEYADELKVSKQYLSNVINGNCPPSDRLFEIFGYKRQAEPRWVRIPVQEKNKMSTTATKIGCAHCPEEFDTDEQLLAHASKSHSEKLRRPKSGTGSKSTTLVNVILDKSGSMSSKVQDVIGGFNTYIEELKKDTVSEYLFTLTLFDTDFVESYLAEPLSKVQNLDTKSYVTGGSTALNDAIGRTIKLIEADAHKAEKIITVIMTDGEENSSHEYSNQAVRDMIQAKEREGWAFIFLGASPDAWVQGMAYGISPTNVARYDPANYRGTYAVVSHATTSASAGVAPMMACFSATPDSMLKSANLSVNDHTFGPHSSGPHSSPPPFVVTTPTLPKKQGDKKWNLQKRKR